MTSFEEQEDFDAETWFMITEVMREKYYPDYLEPEQEVIRANVLNEQQAKTITDHSLLRDWEPRLLPVSPYFMHYNQLGLAQDELAILSVRKEGKSFLRNSELSVRLL